MYGGKFGGNFVPETLKKPIDDLTKLLLNLEKINLIKIRDHYFKINWYSNTIHKA